MSTTDEPPKEAAFFTAIRNWGIVRGPNGIVGGVVEGVGFRIGLARVPGRIIFVVGALFLTGLFLLAYAASWALLPDRDGNIIIQNFGRGVTNVGALIGIGVLALVGLGSSDAPYAFWGPAFNSDVTWAGDSDGRIVLAIIAIFFAVVVPILLIGAVIWLIVYLVRKNNASADGPLPAPSADDPAGPTAAKGGAAKTNGATTTNAAAPQGAATAKGAATATAAPAVAVAPRPAPPVLPRVPGPGRIGYLSALALGFIAAAIVAWTNRAGELAIHPFLAWYAVYLIGLGLILVGVALAGRKLGFLGFIAVPMAALGLLLGLYGDEIRDDYRDARAEFEVAWEEEWREEWEREWDNAKPPLDDDESVDPTVYFALDYTSMFFGPSVCAEGSATFGGEPLTRARVNVTDVSEDSTVEVAADTTTVTVPEGTSIVLVTGGDTESQVVWNERGIWCDFGSGSPHFELTNPGAPVVTLAVDDNLSFHSITIHETTAPASDADEEVAP